MRRLKPAEVVRSTAQRDGSPCACSVIDANETGREEGSATSKCMHLCGVNSQIEDLSVPWVQLAVAAVEEEVAEWLHIIHMHTPEVRITSETRALNTAYAWPDRLSFGEALPTVLCCCTARWPHPGQLLTHVYLVLESVGAVALRWGKEPEDQGA